MLDVVIIYCFCFFKQKTAYDVRISDWSSDVCSSDLSALDPLYLRGLPCLHVQAARCRTVRKCACLCSHCGRWPARHSCTASGGRGADADISADSACAARSEEHTSELQSLMRISYAVFCLKKKLKHYNIHT